MKCAGCKHLGRWAMAWGNCGLRCMNEAAGPWYGRVLSVVPQKHAQTEEAALVSPAWCPRRAENDG